MDGGRAHTEIFVQFGGPDLSRERKFLRGASTLVSTSHQEEGAR